jgi:2,5-diketo-D-gluconate reductase A
MGTKVDEPSKLRLHTGRSMPVMGLGTWELTRDTSGTVQKALRLGYRMIDTADDYGTQPGIGEALQRSGFDRRKVYLVAKVEEDEDSYDSTCRSLAELDQDYADLMLIHRLPSAGVGRDLWEGLIRARNYGLTRGDIGVSNYSVEQIERLIEETGEKPAVNQIEWTRLESGDAGRPPAAGDPRPGLQPIDPRERLDDARLRGRHGRDRRSQRAAVIARPIAAVPVMADKPAPIWVLND